MKLVKVLSALFVMSLCFAVPAGASKAVHKGSHKKPASARSAATTLLDIKIDSLAGETRVHLKADGAVRNYREVRLPKNVASGRPDRFFLDLKKVRLAHPIPAKEVGTALAKVRTGRRPDGVRVVFDSNLTGLFEYTIRNQPDGLLVTIREPHAAKPVVAAVRQAEKPAAVPEKALSPVAATVRPEPKVAGDLDLLIVASDSPDQAREWLDGAPDRRAGLNIMKSAKPGQVISTSFLVTGFASDSNGDYSVAISFTLLDPAGKPVRSERRFAETSGRAPAAPAFIMADPELAFTLDKSDPAGEYTIIGQVEDLTNNKMARSSLKVALEK